MATSKLDRLAGLNYSLENEKSLRKKLDVLGIPAGGTKQMMMRRHTEWVTRWNANVASSRPKSKAQLINDLTTWERTQGVPALQLSATSSNLPQVMSKDFDRDAWSSSHGGDFKDLVAQARKRQTKPFTNGDANELQTAERTAVDQNIRPSVPSIDQSSRPPEQLQNDPSAPTQQPEVIDLDGD